VAAASGAATNDSQPQEHAVATLEPRVAAALDALLHVAVARGLVDSATGALDEEAAAETGFDPLRFVAQHLMRNKEAAGVGVSGPAQAGRTAVIGGRTRATA
jgi:ribulose kinase